MTNIGFIGLGAMGKPMAQNLMRAGFSLTLLTRTRSKADDLIQQGAVWADTPHEVAANSEAVITMLPDTPDVEQVVTGTNGVFAGAPPGSLLIDMSTISPLATRALAQRAEELGIDMLDAPVSGGEVGAKNATLSIMVGGKEAAFQRALPIFQALGKTILHIGESGAGQVCKACNQIVTSIHLAATSEALVFAQKAGVDPAKVRQALLGGSARSAILDMHGQRMLERNFTPGFRTVLHHKDLEIVLSTAKSLNLPLLTTAQVHQLQTACLAAGRGDLDISSMILMIEDLARTDQD